MCHLAQRGYCSIAHQEAGGGQRSPSPCSRWHPYDWHQDWHKGLILAVMEKLQGHLSIHVLCPLPTAPQPK